MNTQNENFDFIRTVSIFSVVLLHTSAGPFKLWLDNWMQFNVIMSATRWCVPVLFMISGALLLKKDEPLVTFFRKRAKKILIPLVFWSYLYIIFARNFNELDPAHANPNVFIEPWLLLKHPAYFHLWFLYAIIGVYLMVPLLRLIAKNSQVTLYSLAMWLVWFSILPFIQSLGYLNGRLFFIFKLDVIPSWSGFALLGFFIHQNNTNIKSIYGIGLLITGLLSTILLTYVASNDGTPMETFQSYLMPNIIVMASGVYILCLKIKSPPIILCRIAKYGFGIYLCHMLVMPLVWRISLFSNEFLIAHGAALAIISSLITFSASLLIVYVISKIEIIKRVI
ncbi:TPA: acyltransferase [Escherichia coli]|uniref:acyltransferase n=1 Tax=Escherichia coli TaxID=562 RepID=UPI000D12DD0A|nr:acyltransferase family protein [Escherichia coli]EEZ5201784.1 acyltransferase family protein [Escherichia coli]EFF1887549.1 acyltransferase family protein [Escherichia coli]EFF7527160.1 acyltransferase family protein [Escherichia coli]EFM5770770.1 acyltransferase family protein [Escherichia coli]EFS5591692.1 acyltransferase family protein [Escherichia coli]